MIGPGDLVSVVSGFRWGRESAHAVRGWLIGARARERESETAAGHAAAGPLTSEDGGYVRCGMLLTLAEDRRPFEAPPLLLAVALVGRVVVVVVVVVVAGDLF